jgi:hypothetical protein
MRAKYTKATLNKFKKYYIETGDAGLAMRKINPRLAPLSAKAQASRLMKRIDLSDILEAQEVTDEVLVKTLKNGLEATRPLVTPEAPPEYIPDFKARHKYLETGLKLKGYLNNNQTIIDNRKLVVALPREDGRVIDGEVGEENAS